MAVLLGSESLSKSYGPRRLFAGILLDVRDGNAMASSV
jgi:hypothetical protein